MYDALFILYWNEIILYDILYEMDIIYLWCNYSNARTKDIRKI